MAAPLTDSVIISLARLVDDAQVDSREPSHSDLEHLIKRSGLSQGDPTTQGLKVGKYKRVRGTLQWAIENNPEAGESLVEGILSHLRGCGGFRLGSQNYVGTDEITNAISAFRTEGFILAENGELQPVVLDSLSGAALSDALKSYIRRAKRGAEDAALLTGTGKDLVEATAAHILVERNGSYSKSMNFEALLGTSFVAMKLSTPQHPVQPGEPPQCKVERAMFDLACSINAMRNKVGTGHGRPWLPNVSETEARACVQFMGTIAELMLHAHSSKP